jgi:DNA-binding winged helix-turn-helix (wHTH) protein/tetratricopeptide (TPR) repeat protein
MLASPSRVLRFDKFTLDLAHCILLEGDQELALRRQCFDVLRHLAEHRGKVVSRDELIKAVWAVEPARPEDSVAQCIKEIRRALGDDARRVIRTVPGRGYAFMAEAVAVETAPKASPTSVASQASLEVRPAAAVLESRSGTRAALHRWQRALTAATLLIAVLSAAGWLIWEQFRPRPPGVPTMMAVPTLAVLPFTAPGDEAAVGGEARAFSDEISTEIARCNIAIMISLKPAAEGTREAAEQLGARYLLLGTLRSEGREHAGDVRLVEAESGRELWALPFRYAPGERTPPAVEIALTAAWHVVATESQRPLPAVPEAPHYAMLAFVSMKQLQISASLSEKALELDPDWVPALLGYAWAQVMLSRQDAPDARAARLDKAHEAVERAIDLAPLNAFAYHRRSQVLRARGDPFGAITANQHALKLSPNLSIAHAGLGLDKIDVGLAHEAVAHIEEAARLTPANRWLPVWCLWAGQASVHAANYDAAVQWLKKAMYANIRNPDVKPWLAVAYAGLGREEEGRALIAQHLQEGRSLTIAKWRNRHPRGNGILAQQRERIEGLLKRLGVPEGKV